MPKLAVIGEGKYTCHTNSKISQICVSGFRRARETVHADQAEICHEGIPQVHSRT